MKSPRQWRYRTLYTAWSVMFVLTALLGLCFPGSGHILLRLCCGGFFLPPWLILAKARAAGNRDHLRLLRYASAASLVLAVVLLCLSILSVRWEEWAGNFLHILMTVVCAPMGCGDFYALSLFGWATVLMGSFAKK